MDLRDQTLPTAAGAAPDEIGRSPGPPPSTKLNNTAISATSSNDSSFRPAVFQSPPVQTTAHMIQPRDEAQPDDGPQAPALPRRVPDRPSGFVRRLPARLRWPVLIQSLHPFGPTLAFSRSPAGSRSHDCSSNVSP